MSGRTRTPDLLIRSQAPRGISRQTTLDDPDIPLKISARLQVLTSPLVSSPPAGHQ